MNTSDARDLFSESPDDGWQPLSVQALAEDLRSTHPQITVLRFHAKGGMGAIYEGRLRDEKGDTISVAIKVLRPDAADDADYVRRFRREQGILATLGDHAHIVRHRLHGTTSEGYPFLVMDWLKGSSLVEFTEDRPDSKLTRQELLQIADDLCSAVQHAHEHQILHRDLKPQNIIVTEEGRAVVLDFGIARSLRPGNTFTQPGDSPGTLGYIAPEVQNGGKPDERADIYSLGIILYQLLMKKLPAPFSAKPSDQCIDPRFDEIVMKAANPEREKRYAGAGELRGALVGLRQSDKPQAQIINGDTKVYRRAPNGIAIEYDDTQIIINGASFVRRPLLQELIEVMGDPDVVGVQIKHRSGFEGLPKGQTFVWSHYGVIAKSGILGIQKDTTGICGPLALSEIMVERILCLGLAEVSSVGQIFPNDHEGCWHCLAFADYVEATWNQIESFKLLKAVVDKDIYFVGTIKIGGFQLDENTTCNEVVRRKRGLKPDRFYQGQIAHYHSAKDCVGLQVGGREASVIHLIFACADQAERASAAQPDHATPAQSIFQKPLPDGLVTCAKCQKPIADDALTCPHCGSVNTQGRAEAEKSVPVPFHTLAYVPSAFWLIAGVLGLIWCLGHAKTAEQPDPFHLGAIIGLVAAALNLWRILELKHEYMVVAPDVIHYRHGVLSYKEDNARRQAATVAIEHPFFGRLIQILGFDEYGTVILDLHGERQITFRGMTLNTTTLAALRGWKDRQ